ncbi:immunoglobulin domain-containing protein [Methanothrix sp.]|uniref:immunoglobulin domain-containing protein n=2 Tax=Methanothrix sp. TaxID=90426 RepID=UPI003BB6D541
MDLNASFGGSYDDELYSIQRTSDAGYIATGRTKSYGENNYDLFLIKADKTGNILWQKNYGGAREDEGYSVEETADGGYIVAGRTRSYGSGMYDVWLMKVDPSGEKTWDKAFGGALDDEASSIKQTIDGGFIIAGNTKSFGSGMYDIWLLKIDQFGGKIWDKTIGGSRDDMGDSIQETSDGGFVVAGTTGSWGNGDADALLIKIDSNGNEQWKKTFGGPRSERNPWSRGWSVQQTSDGGFAMLGSTNSLGSGGYDIWFIKTDANGDKIADKAYGGAYDEEVGSLVETREGHHILIGSTRSFGSGDFDAWLIMTDQNGEKIWDQTFGSKLDDKGYSVIQTDDGSSVFAGKTTPYIAQTTRRSSACYDDCQQKEPATYYDGWLVAIRSAHPMIEIQPADYSACEDQEARFNVVATGNGPITYQWSKNGSQIAGATTDTYIIPAAKLTDAGSYRVRVSNACGSIESNPAVLAVSSKPMVELEPLDTVACDGSEVVLKAHASGTEPLSYQWKKNGENIPGANTNRYLISSILPADEGDYSLAVINVCGLAESGAIHISVRSRPKILVQPISQTVCTGSLVSFEVQVAGNESYTYQWQKDGLNITAANAAVLSISAANSTDQGNYSVIIGSDLCGWTQSDKAELSIRSMPMIKELHLPASKLACEGSDIAFVADVTGSDPVTFRWMKDGLQIPGANLDSFVIGNATRNDSGSYSLIVSNDCGQIESIESYLNIATRPEILVQPASLRVCQGAAATFSVQAESTEMLSYQWFKDGIKIDGATSEYYTIPQTNLGDMGSYSVQVANSCSQVESEAASLDIITMPKILLQPANLKICQGAAAKFEVQAESTEPLSYQWLKDGVNIPGATSESYIIPAANLNDTGSYLVQVANNCSQIESEAAVLDIIAGPKILLQPTNLKICLGAAAKFEVQAESTEPLAYQWLKDGIGIPGAAADTFTIDLADIADMGSYSVLVANNCSQIESEAASLDIIAMPEILAQPTNQKVCQGAAATFSVQAKSSEPLSYQWLKDGVNIPSATSESYTIPAASLSDTGSYSVQAANSCSQIESEAAVLDVIAMPEILAQPTNQKVCQGTAATFSVQAKSSEPLSYQWLKDGIKIEGATSESYIIPAAKLNDTGSYSVQVSNNCSQIESDAANLDIIAVPDILAQPASQKVCQGTTATFSVQAESSEPLSYQWLKDGIKIDGATSESYAIPAASLSDTGSFSVQVANSCSEIESEVASLNIIAMPEILIQPINQKGCEWATATFSVQAESTEPLSYQWFKDGIKVDGATSESYAIPAISLNNTGSYLVQVSNNCSQIESEAASLDIIARPKILLQPANLKICQGAAAKFEVQAESSEPLSYQWLKDGIEIPGAVTEYYIIPASNLNDTGSYSVQVANNCSQIESEATVLDIIARPKILLQPTNLKICQGAAATFHVEASSDEPLEYQWLKDGIEIPGAAADTFTIDLAGIADMGSYSVQVSNNCSQIESEVVSLDIIAMPEILVPPASQKVCQGTAATFAVQAKSTEPLRYQWLKDGNKIDGATSESYTIPAANLNDTGTYSVQVSNNCSQIESEAANLDIIAMPDILAQPTGQKVCQGTTATFSVQAKSTEPLRYQWLKDGANIPGATSESCIVPAANLNDTGSYSVLVANNCSQTESEAVRLDIISSPDILVQPKSLETCEGAAATFSVKASGGEPLEYQWYKDGTEIEGATSNAYSIPVASPSDRGSFWVQVRNNCSQIESNAVVLDIIAKPEILVPPRSQKICQGKAVTFAVQVESSKPLSYQWFKDGIEIPGATQDVYTIARAVLNDTGSYWVQAANNCSQIRSGAAVLEIVALLKIHLPPASQKVCEGATATFSVQAESSEALSYQWFKDGIEIYEATADAYTIPRTSKFDMGNYSVQVRNSCGSIESKAAHLEIVSMPKILVPPKSQRVCQGDAATFFVQASSSEPLSYQWFKDGKMIPGATADTYTITAANLSDTARYSVQIRDECNLIESEAANLQTIGVPVISHQPASQIVCQGTPVTFNVQAISDDPLSYQWFKDGVAIPGATAEAYTVQKAIPGDKGSYYAQARNSCGQTESEAANLDIIALPEILVPPTSQKVCEGSTATFTVLAKSTQPLTYQWIKGGRIIPGANSEELTIFDANIEDMGEYRVAISNSCGFIDSNAVSLIVERPPGDVEIEPDCLIADAGETLAFIMKGTAVEGNSYQWEKNGEIIPGEVSPSLIILNPRPSDSGGYRLTVSNGCGSNKSKMAVLRVVEDSTKVDPCLNPQSACCNSS